MSREIDQLAKIKQVKQKAAAARQGNEKGLYLIFTGLGKGKTSGAMNLVYRHLAHDLRVTVVQFVKNSQAYPDGDRLMLTKLQNLGLPVAVHTLGGGFTWETQNPEQDRQMALSAWQTALDAILNPDIALVLLDELHIALKYQQLDLTEVLQGITGRPSHCHVASTGRYAPQELVAVADLVSEINLVKHHVSQKVPAQLGIEF